MRLPTRWRQAWINLLVCTMSSKVADKASKAAPNYCILLLLHCVLLSSCSRCIPYHNLPFKTAHSLHTSNISIFILVLVNIRSIPYPNTSSHLLPYHLTASRFYCDILRGVLLIAHLRRSPKRQRLPLRCAPSHPLSAPSSSSSQASSPTKAT